MSPAHDWPRITATLDAYGTGNVVVGGVSYPIVAATLDDGRAEARKIIAETAARLDRAVKATVHDPDGTWAVIVDGFGAVTEDPDQAADSSSSSATTPAEAPAATTQGGPMSEPTDDFTRPAPPAEPTPAWQRPAAVPPTTQTVTSAAPVHHGSEYVGRRKSFVDDTPPELAPTHGWRGIAAKAGIKVEVSEAERSERVDQDAVSQHWPGPRTIAVVNGKGGAGKTIVTICLAATFAKYGGIGVLAWDNNQTRGTLGWRTERSQHDSTTLDLIPAVDRLRGPDAQMADLAHYVHHQKRDRFDVLRSQPLKLAADQRISPADVQNLHDVAAKYYRLIIMDSGNDESDPIWQEMIRHADQLVVATGTRADHAEAGALLLEALIDEGGRAAELAAASVVVISQGDVKTTHDDMSKLRTGFGRLAREAVTVRYDNDMVDGALRLDNLKATTQRDWLRAAAAVARGL